MTMSGAASTEAPKQHGSEAMPRQAKPTAYYDGACPLCAREIDFYRRQDGAERICWIDICQVNVEEVAPGLSREKALARFTVRDSNGRLVSGGQAFTTLWRHLPRFNWLGRLFGVQPLAWLLDRAYVFFLKLRPRLQAMLSPAGPLR